MTHILIPREPSTALLRPFIGCNTQELHEAWAAMVRIAEVQHARAGSQCLQQIEEPAGAAPAAVAPQGERQWICPTRTVADLVNNLLTLDQALPAYGAQYIEKDGRRCAIAVPPTVSRERVLDGRWIGQGEDLNAAVVWTRAEQPAAVAGPADELAELAMLNKLIELGAKASYAHAKSNSDDGPAGTASYVQWQELRAEMGELIRAHVAPALEAPAHQCCNSWFLSLPEGRQAVLRDDKWMLASAAYEAGRSTRVALEAPAAPASEHYDELRATLTGLHTLCENISAIERRVGPLGSHARGYTHKITAALRHLDALEAAPQAPAKGLPYEPTSDMLIAGRACDPALPVDTVRAIWWAMWRTAPQAPAAPSEPVYQISQPYHTDPKNTWRDASEAAYDVSVPARRRVLFTGPAAPAAPSVGNWLGADDVRRLVRELDVALHGEADAAPQASLCDIVSLAKAAAGKLGRPVLAAPAAPAVDAASDTALLDAMERHRIALVPEFEGPWDAEIYNDDAEARPIVSGNTPREALRAALAAQAKEGGE